MGRLPHISNLLQRPPTYHLSVCMYVCCEMWATSSCQSTADDISLGIGLCWARASCGRRECPGQPLHCEESRLAGFSPHPTDGSTGTCAPGHEKLFLGQHRHSFRVCKSAKNMRRQLGFCPGCIVPTWLTSQYHKFDPILTKSRSWMSAL